MKSAPINSGFVLIDGVSLDPPFELSKLGDTIASLLVAMRRHRPAEVAAW